MPDVDQHMDDLFRRAAESYPLRIPENDWDQVPGALPPPEAVAKYKLVRPLASTALLLLGGFLLFHLSRKPDPVPARNAFVPIHASNEGSAIPNTDALPSDPALQTHHRPESGGERKLKTRPVENAAKSLSEEDGTTGRWTFENRLLPSPVNRLTLPLDPVIQHAVPYRSHTLAASPARPPEKTGLYIGVTAGIEWNTVKNQGFRSGFNGGLLLGYRFSPHWGLEGAVIISEKHYYSDGKYFDMAQMPGSMPPGMTILSLDGNSTVVEFPVMVNFYPARRAGKWGEPVFSAGINSYLQTKELNRYQVSLNGSEQQMTGKYKSDRRYGAATLQLSAGIEKPLNLERAIRLSPYIQIPLKGIGIGSMQVWSAGIRFSLNSRLP